MVQKKTENEAKLRAPRRVEPAVALPLAAAVLFGASTPLSKILLSGVEPVLLAGLLYAGSGLGLLTWRAIRSGIGDGGPAEARLTRFDLPWLAGAILVGGVAAPILLLFGLQTATASSASLLLNLEGVFTVALAWWVFKEGFDRRLALGMGAIVAACVVLSWSAEGPLFLSWGALLIIAACLGWGVDNNLTRKVSAGDPLQIAAAKGLVAGAANLTVAFAAGAPFPGVATVLACGLLGLLGYGASLVLFIRSLRHLGTARTVAYFSVAPFAGAGISVLLLGEEVSMHLLAGGALMALGVWVHLSEHHRHEHLHHSLDHEHRHAHDAHHDHDRRDASPHSHPHRHREWIHSHPHYPDIHHIHDHR
jgi:drug/metabolite transporter (DMT)-like permease